MSNESLICNPCSTLDECLKYCPVRAGENIVNFVNNISSNTVESHIGDFKYMEIDKRQKTLVVLGYILENGCSPTDIMKVLPDKGFNIKTKFNDYWGMTPTQILKAYTVYDGRSKAVQNRATEDLKRFISPKIIPTPLNIGWDIEVVSKGFDNKLRRVMTEIRMIRWELDVEDGEIKGIIYADVGKTEDGSTIAKLKLSDYGTIWTLPNIERNLKTSEITREAIKMYDNGLIAPIEVTDGIDSFALDSQYMYQIKPDAIYVIGKWDNSDIVEYSGVNDKIHDSKAYKKIKSYIKFANKHRKLIVPYGLGKVNKIEV